MYSLCAIVGRTDDLERKPLGYPSARCIRLEAGVSMVPMSESLLAELANGGAAPGGATVSGAFEFLSPEAEGWAQGLSRDGTAIAYLETEYVAGEGFERAVVWSAGKLALGPLDGAGSINQALRALGVSVDPGEQEFDRVSLGRHRSLDEWL